MFEIGTATDHADLLSKLNTFLTTYGSAFGLGYAGTGNGTLTAYRGGSGSLAETFLITATSATNFTVVGSVSGSIGPATVGTPFSHSKIAFLLTAGGTAFVSGDVFTLSTAPKWSNKRDGRGCVVTATQGNTGQFGAQNLVDGKTALDMNRFWNVSTPITLPQNVELQLRVAATIAVYDLAAFNSDIGSGRMDPTAWTFDYWNGSAWVTLDTRSAITSWSDNEVKRFTIASPVSASLYRLHITACLLPSYKLRLGAIRLRTTATGPSSFDRAFASELWQASGNDGLIQVFVGAHVFERQDADYFNWELAVFDGNSSGAHFYQQPGFQGQMYLPLWNGSIPYWFICDGRRVIVVAKVNAQYEVAYLGLVEPYFSPDQWPYPMAIGGSLAFNVEEGVPHWDDVRFRWSNAANNHRLFTHSDAYPGSYPLYTTTHQLRVRDVDGSYKGYEATENDLATGVPASSKNLIWPFRCGLSLLDKNIDGSYALWPIMLCSAAPNTMGQLSGVCAVTGQDLSAETLIRKGQIDWLALVNVNRTDRDDFIAVALD